MTYDFSSFESRGTEIVDWLGKEYTAIRTGQATPALLDVVKVDSYGAMTPINQVASVGVEDARTLRISPWDAGQIQSIEKAITDADLGVSVAVDDSGLRVIFPELTSDRRAQLLKVAKTKLEEARVSIRGARDEVMKGIEAANKGGDMSDDEKFDAKEELQKLVDTKNKALEDMYTRKETEINQ
ncbi:MAG: ribosome recycling factor [Candidatus Pacebacteria bacterium]|jgi:ribosome recycling factor|nr:ribosome recycling factor [Candidatus Paceibacterota bacterium]